MICAGAALRTLPVLWVPVSDTCCFFFKRARPVDGGVLFAVGRR
jgi:hypothetical protein